MRDCGTLQLLPPFSLLLLKPDHPFHLSRVQSPGIATTSPLPFLFCAFCVLLAFWELAGKEIMSYLFFNDIMGAGRVLLM